MNLNQCQLAGTLGADPELRYTPNGTAVCEIRMAINRKFGGGDGGEMQEETTWLDVTFWGKTAESVAQYFGKGGRIFVNGRLQQDTWEDKQTGAKRSKIKVVAFDFKFCGDSGGQGGEQTGYRQEQDDQGAAPARRKPQGNKVYQHPADVPVAGDDEDEDDIPF